MILVFQEKGIQSSIDLSTETTVFFQAEQNPEFAFLLNTWAQPMSVLILDFFQIYAETT